MKIISPVLFGCLLFWCIPSKLSAQINVSDSNALVSLYNSTNGPLWHNTDSLWLIGPVTGWHGVTTGAGRVTGINLFGDSLNGAIPSNIGDLSALTSLDLSENRLNGEIPSSITTLVNLQSLALNNNNLTGSIPVSIGGLNSLQSLNLSINSLTGNIPAGIGSLSNLTGLVLSVNGFTGSIPASVGNLSNLTNCYINDNSLTGNIPISLGKLSKLAALELYSNSLTGKIPTEFGKLANLGALAINNNKLTGSIPASLGNLTKLSALILSTNQLTDSIPSSIGNLINLTELDLNDNNLSGAIPSSLLNLNALAGLTLQNNRFTFAGLEAVFQQFPFTVYSPQAIIPLVQNGNALIVHPGGTLANNTYTWFRNNEFVATTNGNDTFKIKKAGGYSVQVTNSVLEDLVLATNTVTSGNFFAGFTAAATHGIAPLTVHFKNKSTGSPSTFLWHFGDGNTSTQPSPNYAYSKPGYYRVSLTVGNGGATSNTFYIDSFIIVFPGPGIITTVAGDGTAGYTGDGGFASNARVNHPTGVAMDSHGNMHVADAASSVMRVITKPSGTITTTAGNGHAGNKGDHGKATSAQLNYPSNASVDDLGNMFIADTKNNKIRKVDTKGIITTFAGTGTAGYTGDGGDAAKATLNQPSGIVIDKQGNIYIADTYNNTVRKITPDGTITTIAGTGTAGYAGDSSNATAAKLNQPFSIALDNKGNLYIADTKNNVIRLIDTAGIIKTVAGNGTQGFAGDNGYADTAELYEPMGITTDTLGNAYIADTRNSRIRVLTHDGIIYTIAGKGIQGYAGDSSISTNALLNLPAGLAMGENGSLYVADAGNNTVRKIAVDTNHIILPLTLVNFTAAKYYNAVKCTWLTASEIGLSRFVIERSNDVTNFTAVDSVAARGSAQGLSSYDYIDIYAVKQHAPALYYRLKIVDKDGSITYSQIRKVIWGEDVQRLLVSPNPFYENNFAINTAPGTKLPAGYTITDITGRVIKQGIITTSNQRIILPAATGNGTYIIKLVNGSSALLVKQ